MASHYNSVTNNITEVVTGIYSVVLTLWYLLTTICLRWACTYNTKLIKIGEWHPLE